MHWSDASFGYFPSYLLGSIYDGMFLEAIEADLGPVDDILAAGDVKKITAWLKDIQMQVVRCIKHNTEI